MTVPEVNIGTLPGSCPTNIFLPSVESWMHGCSVKRLLQLLMASREADKNHVIDSLFHAKILVRNIILGQFHYSNSFGCSAKVRITKS